MIEKVCPICGQIFEAAYTSVKYCSDQCRQIGAKQARRSWEQRSGYSEKQRQLMAERRRERSEAIQEANRSARISREEADRINKERAENARKQLIESATAGDLVSIMILAQRSGNWPEYWRAYKAYEIQLAEERGEDCTAKVNSIPVTDPDFEALVIYSIENEKRIYIESR